MDHDRGMGTPCSLIVVQGDLTQLAVDDVLVPCDADLNVNIGYAGLLGRNPRDGTFFPQHSYVRPHESLLPVGVDGGYGNQETFWPIRLQLPEAHPRVWLLDTTTDTHHSAHDLVAAVVRALEVIAGSSEEVIASGSKLAGNGPDDGQSSSTEHAKTRTIALPLVGVKAGGFGGQYADVLDELLSELELASARCGVDIVLVTRERADFAAVQHVRNARLSAMQVHVSVDGGDDQKLRSGPGDSASEWVQPYIDLVTDLAKKVQHGEAVLFIGAGASADAGGPKWRDLLDKQAKAANFSEAERTELLSMDPRDAAIVIASRVTVPSDFADRIAEAVNTPKYSVTQALLASLDLPEAITTNYDTQYERAVASRFLGARIPGSSATSSSSDSTGQASSRPSVLPLEQAERSRPWVLKMHGDADHPGSIVLTRHDYMRFDRDSGPSAAVVQSRMLTGHLIFVGYSLTDANVIRLAREVQRFREAYVGGEVGLGAGRESASKVVGTVIGAYPPGLREDLWRGTLRFTHLEADSDGDTGRNVRHFLDLLNMKAAVDTPFLLDGKYRELLVRIALASAAQASEASTPRGALADRATESADDQVARSEGTSGANARPGRGKTEQLPVQATDLLAALENLADAAMAAEQAGVAGVGEPFTHVAEQVLDLLGSWGWKPPAGGRKAQQG